MKFSGMNIQRKILALLILCIDLVAALIDTVGNVASNIVSTLIVDAKDRAEG